MTAGDTFVVSEVMSASGEDAYVLYALSTTVHYDESALELVSFEVGSADGNVHTSGGDVIFNTYARSLAGYAMKSGEAVCSLTFKVLTEGSTELSVSRVNMSNYTGMRSMPCTATGLEISTGQEQAVAPKDSPEGTTQGTATEEDVEKSSISSLVEAVKADPSSILEDGKLTQKGYQSLIDAGMTDEELISLGFSADDLEQAKSGQSVESDVSAGNTAAGNTSAAGEKESVAMVDTDSESEKSQDSFPWVPVAAGVIGVVVVCGIIAFALSRRRKRS